MNFLESNPNYSIDWKQVLKVYENSLGIPKIIGKKINNKRNFVEVDLK